MIPFPTVLNVGLFTFCIAAAAMFKMDPGPTPIPNPTPEVFVIAPLTVFVPLAEYKAPV
jgi:hypothetical protein